MKNFKLLEDDTIYVDGHTLYRIEATRDFGEVNCGDVGGYVESLDNLDNNAWVFDNARVFGNARVYGDALVSEDARVYGNAWVYGDALVSGNATVYDNARVFGNALVFGKAFVYEDVWVYDTARVSENAWVCGKARVFGKSQVYGTSLVCGNARVFGKSHVYGNSQVSGNARVYGNAQVYGDSKVLKGSVKFDGEVINITSNGVLYPITILPKHIQIGCQCHSRSAWFRFTDSEIRKMDGEKAVVWWKTWKPILKSICDANASGDEQC